VRSANQRPRTCRVLRRPQVDYESPCCVETAVTMSVAWPQQRCQQPAAAIVPPRARCGTAAAAKQYRPHRHSLFGAGEKLPSPGTNSSCFVSNDAEPSPTQYATTPMRFYCLRVSNPLKSIVIVGSAATAIYTR